MPSVDRRVVRAIDNRREVTDWHGEVWRGHVHGVVGGKLRTATDCLYTLDTIGRWHLGKDHPSPTRFPALYASILGHVAEAEFLRHLDQRRRQSGTRINLTRDRYRLSELAVNLSRVFDLRDLAALGLTCEELCRDVDYDLSQQLAAEAHRRGAQGLLLWSCAVEPDCSQVNLVVFADGLPPGAIRETGQWTQIRPLP